MGYDGLRTASRSSPHPPTDVYPTTDSLGDGVEDVGSERRDRIAAFVREAVDSSGADGVVVPMSGGVDSTLTAMLATEALGSSRVFGLLLPCNLSDDSANHDAQVIAEALGVEYREIHLRPLLDRFEDLVGPAVEPEDRRRAIGNVLARLRMTSAYYVANATNRLVLGTTNRTEWLLGYFTKHGDGGADLRPLAELYKTQLYALAYRMGVPRRIIEKPPTAGLWSGQTDEADLGASYETVDAVLDRYGERGERPA
ncbi:NAD+ synthase, partial [Halobium palmae]